MQTDLAWWIKCNCGKRADYQASELGEKKGTMIVTENTTDAPRIVTITVGYDETTVTTLNFVQNPSNGSSTGTTLVYDRSTLPTGNIPQSGGTYTFTFTGTYTGEVQVRALIDGVAQTPGTSATNKQPQVSVPASTLATTRNITFQYKRADGDWTALPTSTNRVQDGTNGGGETPGGNITPGKILPPGDVPEGGRSYFCQFKGTGSVFFRALRNGTEVSRSPEGTATPTGVNLSVTIPPLGDTPSSTISFEYSIDGGNTWINMNDNRTQNQTYVVVDTPVIKELPAKNASASFGIRGTSQEAVTIGAYVGRVLIGSATAYPTPEGLTLKVPVDDNPGPNYRLVSFSWTLDGENWGSTPPVKQLAP